LVEATVVAALWVAACGASAPAAAQDLHASVAHRGNEASWISVSVREPASPFSVVTWELKQTRVAPVVALTRVHALGFGEMTDLVVVTPDRYREMLSTLSSCWGVLGPVSASSSDGFDDIDGVELRGVIEGRSFEWRGASTGLADECVEATRRAVLSVVRPERYRNPFWEEGDFGLLRTTSPVPAWVWVDGVPTGMITPVASLAVEPGVRTVRWVPVAGGEPHEREVTITAGTTTSVDGSP
jgi:hypothetical protein